MHSEVRLASIGIVRWDPLESVGLARLAPLSSFIWLANPELQKTAEVASIPITCSPQSKRKCRLAPGAICELRDNSSGMDLKEIFRTVQTILVIDWPSKEVPETLARAGFRVVVRGGPGLKTTRRTSLVVQRTSHITPAKWWSATLAVRPSMAI